MPYKNPVAIVAIIMLVVLIGGAYIYNNFSQRGPVSSTFNKSQNTTSRITTTLTTTINASNVCGGCNYGSCGSGKCVSYYNSSCPSIAGYKCEAAGTTSTYSTTTTKPYNSTNPSSGVVSSISLFFKNLFKNI